MNLAVFSDNFYPETNSGITESITTIARELASRGHRIHFFAPRYSRKNFEHLGLPFGETDLGPNIQVTRFASFPFNTGTENGRLVIPFGRVSSVKAFRPDVIHVHLPFGMGLEGLIAAKILKVPLVGTNHTPVEFTRKLLPPGFRWFAGINLAYNTWFYNRCNFVSSPASAMFKEMKGFNAGIPHRAVSNPLKTDFFMPLGDRAELKKKNGFSEFTLLFIGRLSNEKNVDQLLRAAAELKGKIPSLSVGIASTGPAEQKLRKLTLDLGLKGKVRFLGFLGQEELREAYNAADVFVMPSTVETQSLSSMEAMLCGLPVVAVHSMGLDEYLKPEAGFLLAPGDVEGLADKILYLYTNPRERLQMGKVARKSVEYLSKEDIASEWEKIYEETIRNYHKR